MSLNLDPIKQAQNVIVSKKVLEIVHPLLLCNNNKVARNLPLKHLGVFLDERLTIE